MNRANLGTVAVIGLLFAAAVLAGRSGTHAGPAAPLAGGVDFVVSNAADAGPGSLRDAILAADRLTNRAHISIKVKKISIDSALPALVNPHGVVIDASAGFGVIDAVHQTKGTALQVNSPTSLLRGITIVNAHEFAVVVNAPGFEMDTVTLSESKVGLVLGAAAHGAAIRTSLFDHDETALTAEGSVRDITVLSTIFRNNIKAGFWFVGAVDKEGDNATPERARLIDTVFEKNAAGVVVANRPVLVQKSRFIGNFQSAVLILGGEARVEDSEIRDTLGTAISVSSGKQVTLARNTITGNLLTAIMVRDSQVTIDHNTLRGNASGIVSISSQNADGIIIRDNTITKCSADAITVIGGSPRVQRNQVSDNHGAGLRTLNLVSATGELKATPQLDANVFKGNGSDQPPPAVYKLAGTLPR